MSKKKENTSLSKREQRLFDNLLKATHEFIKGRHYSPQTKQSLIDRLNIHKDHLNIFESVLHSLKGAGEVHIIGEKYHQAEAAVPRLAPGEFPVRGTISIHPRGFGFVNRPSPHEDIFIPKALINGAVDGDLVDAIATTHPFSEKGPEGRVVDVIQRKHRQVAGTVTEAHGKTATVYSSLLGEIHPIICHIEPSQKVKKGDRVLLNVRSWGQKREPTECSLEKVLGHVSDPSVDVPFVIAESGIRQEFPPAAIEEAKRYGTRVKPSDLKGRVDLRELLCVTIDPDTAKDFDDAISIEKIGSDYRVGVHIADVSYYVRPESAMDTEARLRCNSTYFPNTCIPMLPRELSENLCSLKPNVMRLTVSVFFNVTQSGETTDWEIVRSVIKSKKRFTYREVKAILDGAKSQHKPLLQAMEAVCERLKKRRSERGSVQLYVPEMIVKVDEKGVPTGMDLVEYDISHQMVEECMLKANEIVAIHLGRRGKDVSYRVHEEPAEESLKDFSSLVSSYGYYLPDVPTPQDIQKFFLEVEGSPHASYLAVCYIKSMRLACYSPDNIGHYGLSLEHYCHFTSPIRRYIDVIIHRLLLEDGPDRATLTEICQEASERERSSAKAEGTVVTIKKLRLLEEQRRKKPNKSFGAIITRVKPFGIFFDITSLMLEGFLHVSELEDDYFLFDDDTSRLEGCDFGHTYGSGDHIIVRCERVDISMQEASWVLVKK
jgi:ribonuclease R